MTIPLFSLHLYLYSVITCEVANGYIFLLKYVSQKHLIKYEKKYLSLNRLKFFSLQDFLAIKDLFPYSFLTLKLAPAFNLLKRLSHALF